MRKILMVLLMLIMLVSLTGCKEETIDYNLDGYYNGDLVCQHVAISSWVTGFNIEIKENVLFIDELEIGKFEKKMLTLSKDLNQFTITKEHQDFFNNISNINEGYIIELEDEELDNAIILVEYLENYYLLMTSYIVGFGYEILKGYYLNDEVLLTFTDYPGGCIVMEHQERVKIGSTYSLDRASEIIGIDTFIDLKTLTIYRDSFVVTKNLDLVSYNNGVYDVYIYNYLFNNNDFEFDGWFTSIDKIKQYNYETLDNGDIKVIYDDITYIFKVSKQLGENNYYVSNISANKNLFNLEYEKAKEILDLLYVEENYSNYLITIELNENSYNVKLEERTING